MARTKQTARNSQSGGKGKQHMKMISALVKDKNRAKKKKTDKDKDKERKNKKAVQRARDEAREQLRAEQKKQEEKERQQKANLWSKQVLCDPAGSQYVIFFSLNNHLLSVLLWEAQINVIYQSLDRKYTFETFQKKKREARAKGADPSQPLPPRKKWRPGSVALQEIRYYQRGGPETIIPKTQFARYTHSTTFECIRAV